jgi:phosphate transport system protein
MRDEFERHLKSLTDDVLQLSSRVDLAIASAIEALKSGNQDLAQQVIAEDAKINELRFEVEELCFRLILTQQPVARDLRKIVTATNIALELERMGDHAKGMAVIVQRMGGEPPIKPLIDIPRMADIARTMLRESLDAFTTNNVEQARQIAQRDDEVDQAYTDIFHELVELISKDTSLTTRAMFLLFAAHNLERIADRVTNICERVVFLGTGQFSEFPAGAPNI